MDERIIVNTLDQRFPTCGSHGHNVNLTVTWTRRILEKQSAPLWTIGK